jgi:hypothetical protein
MLLIFLLSGYAVSGTMLFLIVRMVANRTPNPFPEEKGGQ